MSQALPHTGGPRWQHLSSCRAVLLACTLATATALTGCGPHSSGRIATGMAQHWLLPPTSVQRIDNGRTLRLDRLHRPALLNFWATWCEPCAEEVPSLRALAKSVEPKVAVIGVAMDSGSPQQIRSYVQRHRLYYQIVTATDHAFGPRFDLVGFPITLLVDASGVVRRRFIGPQTEATFAAAIRALPDSGT